MLASFIRFALAYKMFLLQDTDAILNILYQLLTNAIKYTDGGINNLVSVRASLVDESNMNLSDHLEDSTSFTFYDSKVNKCMILLSTWF